MNILLKKVTKTEKETRDLGKKIIKKIPSHISLIILKGELGAGKTALVKGMAIQLGIKDDIKSPTFGYKRQYKGLIHYDLYLTKKMKSKELVTLISEDMEENIVAVEWGNKLPKIKNSLIVEINMINDVGRSIVVKEVN